MKTAVLLSGCGVFDGTEIHEAVFSLLALAQNNLDCVCVAPDIQHNHVLNYTNGEELNEERNVLLESSRIARGAIVSLADLHYNEISSLVIPGGFGVAKNLSDWAFKGPEGHVLEEVKDLILHCVENKKPIVALCISPTLIAKCLSASKFEPQLTLGTTADKSEYSIAEINQAITSLGAKTNEKTIQEICVDEDLKIISAPCYMMDASIEEVYENVKLAIEKLANFLA
ncbi:MAG: isoprenoid biosynthesis protein ElbB [Flavobacteriales bacterium TMED123]|nr:MAG: isoprenoid biosynthesis protein ElbB [Flavobacteriales bacterium TMED123]|tara:strand:- start:7377 stop:8060 length:684 start_codon:yes stop_codon:yes gene_type:complete